MGPTVSPGAGLDELLDITGPDARAAVLHPDRREPGAAKVDVIVAGSTQGALAAKAATVSIPIVFVMTGDPVATGLVVSLARPGGNLTGVTALGQTLSPKRLEILKEAVPGVTRVAVLANPAFPDTGPALKALEGAARTLGVGLRVVEVSDPADLDKAFVVMRNEHVDELMVLGDPMFNTHRTRIVERAARSRLPAMYPFREWGEHRRRPGVWAFPEAAGRVNGAGPGPV